MKILRYCIMCLIAILAFGTLFASTNSKELAKVDGIIISETDFRRGS